MASTLPITMEICGSRWTSLLIHIHIVIGKVPADKYLTKKYCWLVWN